MHQVYFFKNKNIVAIWLFLELKHLSVDDIQLNWFMLNSVETTGHFQYIKKFRLMVRPRGDISPIGLLRASYSFSEDFQCQYEF